MACATPGSSTLRYLMRAWLQLKRVRRLSRLTWRSDEIDAPAGLTGTATWMTTLFGAIICAPEPSRGKRHVFADLRISPPVSGVGSRPRDRGGQRDVSRRHPHVDAARPLATSCSCPLPRLAPLASRQICE